MKIEHICLWVSLAILFRSCDGFHLNLPRERYRRSERVATPLWSSSGPQICLPIIQVYENNVLLSEFFIGNDPEGSLQKFRAFMSSFSRDSKDRLQIIKDTPTLKYISYPIENAYTEHMISSFTASDPIVVLKLYRSQCKRCQQLEPVFRDIATTDLHSHIRFIQGNIDDMPGFKLTLKQRLSGKDNNIGDVVTSCGTCGNSGTVSCVTCSGNGIVRRGKNFLMCPTCTGKKRVRCTGCNNGRCIHCD